MPCFYFDVVNNGRSLPDETGTDMALSAVRDEGIILLAQFARDRLPDGDRHVFEVSVRDEADAVVFRASLTLEARWLVDPAS